jgi:hypothetical protein
MSALKSIALKFWNFGLLYRFDHAWTGACYEAARIKYQVMATLQEVLQSITCRLPGSAFAVYICGAGGDDGRCLTRKFVSRINCWRLRSILKYGTARFRASVNCRYKGGTVYIGAGLGSSPSLPKSLRYGQISRLHFLDAENICKLFRGRYARR